MKLDDEEGVKKPKRTPYNSICDDIKKEDGEECCVNVYATTDKESCGCSKPSKKQAPQSLVGDYVQDSNYVHTDNNYTDEDKEKLEELEETVNEVESELSQKSTVSVSPTGTSTDEISYITIDGVEKKIAGLERPIGEGVLTLKKDNNDPGDTFSANAANDKTINLNLSTVASTGSYNDLLDKPADIIRNIKGYFVAGITQIEVPFKSSEFGEYPLLRAYNNWQLELIGELSYIDYGDEDGNDRKVIIKFYSNGSQVNVQENGFYILG